MDFISSGSHLGKQIITSLFGLAHILPIYLTNSSRDSDSNNRCVLYLLLSELQTSEGPQRYVFGHRQNHTHHFIHRGLASHEDKYRVSKVILTVCHYRKNNPGVAPGY